MRWRLREAAAWGGCFAALLSGVTASGGRLRGGGRVQGGCARRWREAHPPKKKQPREFSQTPGVNDVCQFMASISGVDIVCDDYMAK